VTTIREILPARRACETFELRHGNQQFNVTIGRYPDGRPAEVFINGPKVGSELEVVARDAAVLISIALQSRVPLGIMRHAITREANGDASTIIGQVIDLLASQEPSL
jgi:hypothetical protein